MNEFFEKLKDVTEKGFIASKEIAKNAGEKVQDLSEKGVAKFEQTQLESKLKKQFIELGSYIVDQIEKSESDSLSFSDTEVVRITTEIAHLKAEIENRKNI